MRSNRIAPPDSVGLLTVALGRLMVEERSCRPLRWWAASRTQGSSREHAVLAPRYLGLRVVIAKGFSRIHWQNLVKFRILPLTLDDEVEYGQLDLGDILQLRDLHKQIRRDRQVEVRNATRGRTFTASPALAERQVEVLFAGGLIRWARARLQTVATEPATEAVFILARVW